jgi:hypothetical protein
MPQTLTYGQNTFTAHTRQDLDKAGKVVNPNMWLGDGWYFCKVCKKYTFHYAMSTPKQADCFEVCRECDNYSGNQPVEVISNGQNTSA